ncbi:alpha/beta fold hydrolase [Aestuariivivens insulae]|uniref:alpha/beta fold hydrolase n=1 Tax=Aestuariivivens insulae TaxID=1621988 RepID=UPI001F5AC0D8|nr:alpha/beta hydrolase [Aestuariivivens insulae]
MNLQHKNTSIFYTDEGHGEAIVLLHGFLENSTIWDPFINDLSKKHRILCIDLLGHGQTECMGYIHTMEMMAEAVHAVLTHLNIKACTVIGHSMGGYVALALTEKYPNNVNGLLLVNSTSQKDSKERKQNRDRAIAAVKHDHRTFIRIAIANLFNPENKTQFSKAIEQITHEALKTPLQGIVAALEGMKIRPDRTKILKHFNCKKVIFISEKDPVLDYKSLIKEAKTAKLEIVEFPDGHMSFIENEAFFFLNLMHFIEK